MNKETFNGQNSVATSAQKYEFKYVETTWIDGNEITDTEKIWTADNLDDYDKFRDIWEELEAFDEHYELTEVGSLLEDGNVSMVLDYTLETDQRETIKFIRGISYKIAE
jgi:hypothetical protein